MNALLLTFDETADLLGVGVNTVRNLVNAGQLVAVPVGRRYRRITRAEVERYVTNLDRASYGLQPVRPPREVEAARLRLVEGL